MNTKALIIFLLTFNFFFTENLVSSQNLVNESLLKPINNILENTEAKSSLQENQLIDKHLSLQDLEIIGLYALSKDSTDFLTVSASGQVSIWKLNTNSHQVLFQAGQVSKSCDFIQESGLLAFSQDTQVVLFSVKEKRQLEISPRLGTKSSSVAFAPDSKSIVIGGEDGKVYRWIFDLEQQDRDNSKTLRVERYIGHSAAITALVFHPYNRFFFSADSFGKISAWQTYDKDLFAGQFDKQKTTTTFYAEDGNRVQATSAENATVLNMRISADGQQLFSALQDGRVEWRLVRGLKLIVTGKLNSGALYDIQLSPDASKLASIARDGKLRIWSLISVNQKITGKIKDEKILEYNNIEPASAGYFKLLNEFDLPDVRKMVFINDSSLIVGEQGGRLLEVKL